MRQRVRAFHRLSGRSTNRPRSSSLKAEWHERRRRHFSSRRPAPNAGLRYKSFHLTLIIGTHRQEHQAWSEKLT
jgi:hypothetical protein